MSYWTVKRKVKKKKKKSLEDNLPVNPKPPAGADVTHASNCDDSNTVLIHSQVTVSSNLILREIDFKTDIN